MPAKTEPQYYFETVNKRSMVDDQWSMINGYGLLTISFNLGPLTGDFSMMTSHKDE